MPPAEELYAENLQLKEEIALLRTQIDWLKRKLFGGGQSERLDRTQLLLALGDLEKKAEAHAALSKVLAYERKAVREHKPAAPAEAFAHLPVSETIVIEPEEVKADPKSFERIGEERTFEIDVVPPKLTKREIVRPKYQFRKDRTQAPVVAPAPARPVPGGYASAGLLAWIAISKYVDHLPLFRLEKMSARWGAKLPRQNMAEWIRIIADWLEVIYKQMLRDLLASGYVQADETPVKCNDPDHPGSTRQGFLWVVSRPGGDVVFDWRLTRRHGELTTLLTDNYKGLLQSDGYEAYSSYVKSHEGVTWVGCWAHARRKFNEALCESPQRAGFMLCLIGHLYRYERQWDKSQSCGPALRSALRSGSFSPTLSLLKRTALRMQQLVRPSSNLGKACAYLLNHWQPLCSHLEHGRTRLDTNLVENAIRPSCIGKKNWLFIGHPQAGQRSAIIYSIVISCQRHGKDPLAYLKDVLTRLPAMTNQDDLTPLLPRNWQPT